MKHLFSLVLASFFGGQYIHAQNSYEDTNSIITIDPIWIFAQSDDTLKDFSSFDFSEYQIDESFDFNRYSEQAEMQQSLAVNDSSFFSFNGVNIVVDNVNYFFNGDAIAIPHGTATLLYNGDTLTNLSKLNIKEDYFLLDELNDTIAIYKNEYYCFVDNSGEVHFEIYNKNRTVKNSQTEKFIGIGTNSFIQGNSSIGLVLNPNPNSTTTVTASFTLPLLGDINILISNQIGTVYDLIYSSSLGSGMNSVPLDISNYPSGTYEITVYYNSQNYSQTLIKQ